MLRKTRKLNLSWPENQQFFREFSIYRSPSLTIYYRVTDLAGKARLSVVVGKRISNSAVVRNKLKRQLYISVQQANIQALNLDIVMVAIKSATQQESLDILNKFKASF
jgi:ribonuclease P protein component